MSEAQAELLRGAIAGDRDALEQLLMAFGPDVRATLQISAKWQSSISDDDIMQVTYLEAFLRIGRFRASDPAQFKNWLIQIAQNNLKDAIRGLQRDKRPPVDRRVMSANVSDESYCDVAAHFGVTFTTPSRVAAAREAKELVERALGRLPADYALALRMFDLEGRSGPDVAQALGRSRGAAFMLASRARDALREALGSESRYFGNSS